MSKHAAVLGVIGLVVAAVGWLTAGSPPATAQVERTLYVAAIEPKGGQTVDKEPFPTAALPAGGGYVLNRPDANGRWEVSSYQWSPGTVVVNRGERVNLEFVGINGAEHTGTIESYVQNFIVKRGQITRVSFNATRAGVFRIICANHQPSMTGTLVVLGR